MKKADQEIHKFNQPGHSPGPVGSRGGRNRLTGGIDNVGATKLAGAKGGTKSNGDAMHGSYNAGRLTSAAGVQTQDQLRSAGSAPIDAHGSEAQKGGPWKGHNMKVERAKMTEAQAQQTKSMQQGPSGKFGGNPGQTAGRRNTSYISTN